MFGSFGRLSLPVALMAFEFSTVADANAAVVISANPTKNVVCSAGVCSPTGNGAVLNVGDLENMLASGSLKIVTKGAGVQAKDIAVQAGFSWASGSALTLDAHETVTINQPISDAGTGHLRSPRTMAARGGCSTSDKWAA